VLNAGYRGHSGHSGHSGITLVELMVTLAILGLVLVAAFPSVTSWMRNNQIRTAAIAVLNGLNKARNEAVRRNSNVRFSLVTTTPSSTPPGALDNTCQLSSNSASWVVSLQVPTLQCGAGASDTAAPMIIDKWEQRNASSAVTAAVKDATCTAAATTNTVVFNAYGRVASDPGNAAEPPPPLRCIVVDHSSGSGNRKLNIVVSTGGSVRLCDPAVTDATDPRKC
jgi:type IV fimbrial biogenesis protein FimT